MTNPVTDRIQHLGLILPSLIKPTANYELFRRHGKLLFMAGQTSFSTTGTEYKGQLKTEADIERGYQAARLCALNLIGALSMACNGDLSQVIGCVKINGYILATPEFTSSPAVINGASDLIIDIFGNPGRHARTAIGVASLPGGYTAEVEAIFEVK